MRYRFDDFVFDPDRGLTRGCEEVVLEPRAHELLRYFLENPGRVISRDELSEALWDGKIVSDAAISTQIRSVRRALGDDREQMRYLRTHPRRGFSFMVEPECELELQPDGQSESAHELKAHPPTAVPRGTGRARSRRWFALSAVIVVVAAVVAWIGLQVKKPSLPKQRGPSIAVLPFENLSEDPGLSYLADAFTEDLITDLSRIRDSFVISRSTSFTYRGRNVGAGDVAAELGVRYVLEGSVRVQDEHVRVNAQLIDGTTDKHIWSERYDRTVSEFFSVGANVTGQIASVLRAELRKAEDERQSPQVTQDAWDHALRGNVLLYHRKDIADFQEAFEHLSKSVELDPSISSAWGGLAFVHMVASFENIPGVSRADSTDLWLETALRATRADPMNAEPYWLVGVGYARIGQTELGMPACRTAIELNPNMDCGYVCAGLVHLASDEPEKAIPYFKHSLKLNPFFRPFTKEKYLGLAYIQSEQDDLAIAALGRALAAAPTDGFANLAMSAALALDGRAEDARARLEKYLGESGAQRPSVEALRSKLEWMGAKTDRMLRGLSVAGL